jgi:hypothetical protein
VEPGEDDVSAWCKLHGAEFKGEKIPFGALVYFKPSGARTNEQGHKFDPKGIPGVFAGYEIAPGVNWRRQYMAFVRHDKTELLVDSFNTKTTIEKLWCPHLTEKIEVHYPLTFPCKDIYEKVNTTLEGLAVKVLKVPRTSLRTNRMMMMTMTTMMMTMEVMTDRRRPRAATKQRTKRKNSTE